jgi:NitT/TauT family transport system substrate-binding protein
MRGICKLAAAVVSIALAMPATKAWAEASQVSLAKQYGDSYLPMMVMEHDHLIEAHARKAGLGDVTVRWVSVSGGGAANSALLSGSIDFVSGGIGPMLQFWSASGGKVKGMAALNSVPLLLNVNKASIKTIADFTSNDKIAVPAIGVSMQAVVLRMAAAKAFGPENAKKLDHLTVTMKQGDAALALISGKTEITAHFANSPFEFQELEHQNIHTVLNSYEVLGGPATFGAIWTTNKFHDENPKLYRAVLDALQEATEIINKDKRAAARLYIDMTHSKLSIDFIHKILTDPSIGYEYSLAPVATMKYATFMHQSGQLKLKAESWKDYFFPEIHHLSGS